jgi:protein farnesyltransferase/geranylgeranyltransferase type-1 subunit alpha
MPLIPGNTPFFAERPEWADVQPLEQYDDVNAIAPIFYTEECESLIYYDPPRLHWLTGDPKDKDATNYFRAIVRAGEKSPRVLELTESVIRQNPAHYSAW